MKRIVFAGLIALPFAGCRLFQGLFALFTAWIPETPVPARVELKGETIVVMATVAPTVPDRYAPLAHEIVSEFRKILVMKLDDKTIIDDDQMFEFRSGRPDWGTFTREEVGKHFKADHVIEWEVRRLVVNTRGSPAEYRAQLEGAIRMVEMIQPDPGASDKTRKRRGKVRFNEEIAFSDPPEGKFVMEPNMTPSKFLQRIKRGAAREYALWFYPHPSHEEKQRRTFR